MIFFSVYLKQKFSKIGIQAWFVDIETSKIEKLKIKNKFQLLKKEIKYRCLGDYIISYSFSKYSSSKARRKQNKIIEKIKKDEKFFERLKRYFQNKNFKKLNKLIENS